MKNIQTEFEFSTWLPKRVPPRIPARVPTLQRPRSRRAVRRAAPQTNRLRISPEAFEGPQDLPRSFRRGLLGGIVGGIVGIAGRHHEGVVETLSVLLATIVFGLGWAAIEAERVELVESGYAGAGPAPTAFWNLAAAHSHEESAGDDPVVDTRATEWPSSDQPNADQAADQASDADEGDSWIRTAPARLEPIPLSKRTREENDDFEWPGGRSKR